MKGKIHSFQSFGTADGPGVRFIVFMHGCNLSCGYCHNVDVCHGDYEEYSPQEVLSKVLRCRDYFGDKGGITVSGGEALLQAEFITELFSLCKENSIHTCLDTSGSIFNSQCESLLSYTDLVLLDIKMTNDDDYKKYIGCSLSAPLNFLEELEKRQIKTIIRHVVVGGLNDTEENILKLKELTAHKKCVSEIELLPFRKICEEKYKNMSITFPFKKYVEPDGEKMESLNELLC